MAEFEMNTHGFDSYKNFRFRIKWDGKYVAGFSKISALKTSLEPVSHREGGDTGTSLIFPGTRKFEPVTLERGFTLLWGTVMILCISSGDDRVGYESIRIFRNISD